MAGYYRMFVDSLSSIASPMTKLTQKKAKFMWTNECKKSFQTLKDKLFSAPILVLPEALEGFLFILMLQELVGVYLDAMW
ncbi:MAG: hypothetical protein Q8834_02930 [Candidatus Phytoplasma australasiaticum]|nr:hypothetical protein [Candidatus Phytoplasma australasiaticum]